MSAFDLAEKLYREAQNEDEYRAAASRAYAATFQHLMKHPSAKGFHATRTGEDHRLLIDYLKRCSEDPQRTIGQRMLPRLRAIRNHADYDFEARFTKGMAQQALEDASEIIHLSLPSAPSPPKQRQSGKSQILEKHEAHEHPSQLRAKGG